MLEAVTKGAKTFSAIAILAIIQACSDDIGTKAWCDNLRAQPKQQWSTKDAADYAKHCVFQ